MKNSGRAAAALVLTLLVAAVPAVAAAVAAPDWGTKSTILKNVHAYAFASGLRFYEVLVGYQLQISPAPASPTFGDSPDDAYLLSRDRSLRGVRDIRRMLQWKPNQTVTRGEMAAFFARALDLHFPF